MARKTHFILASGRALCRAGLNDPRDARGEEPTCLLCEERLAEARDITAQLTRALNGNSSRRILYNTPGAGFVLVVNDLPVLDYSPRFGFQTPNGARSGPLADHEKLLVAQHLLNSLASSGAVGRVVRSPRRVAIRRPPR